MPFLPFYFLARSKAVMVLGVYFWSAYVAFMLHGVAGRDWKSLKRKENCCDTLQHQGGQELVPRAARLAVLVNPTNPLAEAFIADIRGGNAGHSPNRSFHRPYKSGYRHCLCDAGGKAG
jgi:hypothetical protein